MGDDVEVLQIGRHVLSGGRVLLPEQIHAHLKRAVESEDRRAASASAITVRAAYEAVFMELHQSVARLKPIGREGCPCGAIGCPGAGIECPWGEEVEPWA